MPDISPSMQQQVAKAIEQLNKVSASNPGTRQGTEVLVNSLSNQAISLSIPNRQQTVRIPNTSAPAQPALQPGRTYHVQLATQGDSGQLEFTPKSSPGNSQTALSHTTQVSQQQLSQIVQSLSRQGEIQSGQQAVTLNGKVLSISGQTVTVQLGQASNSIKVALQLKPGQSLPTAGQQVALQLGKVNEQFAVSLPSKHPVQNGNPSSSAPLSPPQLQTLLKSTGGLSLHLAKEALIAALKDTLPANKLMPLKELLSNTAINNLTINLKHRPASAQLVLTAHTGGEGKITLPVNQEVLAQLQRSLPVLTAGSTTSGPLTPAAIDKGAGALTHNQTVQKAIHTLLRQSIPLQDSPAQTLSHIVAALQDSQVQTVEAKQIINQLSQLLNKAIPQGQPGDLANIKALLGAPPVPLTAVNIAQPVAQQGMLAGLTTLMQTLMNSRLSRSSAAASSRLASALAPFVSAVPGGSAALKNVRTQQDLSQLEQRHNLLKNIGKILANHQAHKLMHSEQMLNGQETLYYVLPSGSQQSRQDIELLLRRTPQEDSEQKSDDQHSNRTWQLTMKLGIGEAGEMLVKAKLKAEQLDVDFYTSNDALKGQAAALLPLFRERLTSLGIEVGSCHCQLGAIPPTLAERPYSIVETRA